jgi:antitoxin (DNA-binding transcriptional repressor) of toxin-antitoxin stability system
MRTVTVSEFRAHILTIFNEIAATGVPVLLTKRTKPLFLLESGGYVTVSQEPQFAQVRIPNICVGRPAGWRC